MADNQMVKIVFDFDLGNVPASAKKLSQYLKENNLDLKFTKQSLDNASAGLTRFSVAQNVAATSIASTSAQLKKSNMQWTNLALVIQDLPYGFRGIQNNLPALLGGIAGVAGPLYLVGSAVIAFFTAWDNGMIKFGNTVKLTTNFSKEAATAYSNETIQLESLYRVATDVNVSMDERLIAAQELKKEYPGLLGLYSDEDIALGKADKSYKDLTKTIWEYAQVKAAEKTLEELAIKQNDLTVKKNKALATQKEREINLYKEVKSLTLDEMTFTQRFVKMLDDLPKGPLMLVRAYESLDRGKQNLIGIEAEQKSLNEETKLYKDIIDGNVTSVKKLDDYTKKPTKQGGKTPLELAKEQARLIKAANDAETQAFINTLDVRAQKEYKAGLQLADNLETMRAAGYTDSTTYYAEYRQNMLNIAKHYDDIEYKRNQDSIQANIDFETKIYNDSNRVWDQIQKEKLAAQIAFAKRQTSSIETELNVQDKLNRNSLRLRIEDTKQALAKLAVLAAFTFDPKVLGVYLDAIDKMTAKLKGLGGTWEETTKAIDSIIKSFINDSLFVLGDSIGKALMGENVDALDAFGNLLADAIQALGKQLIAYGTVKLAALKALETTTPMGALLAIAAGIAAVAAGAALKSSLNQSGKSGINSGSSSNAPRKFANGGIISGPTYGLMGEYPGARANPEVVAPLDKLKDMIGGGGGGTFMLRGQDLLLSVNRAQKASNLKGQNISLV